MLQKPRLDSQIVAEFLQFCFERHDTFCNQKYDSRLPYSMHLRYVLAQHSRFKHLLSSDYEVALTKVGCAGHDLIEDARMTFNDIVTEVGVEAAEIIFACTETRGHDRPERHSKEYYDYLAKNDLAVFVKLCDILANVKYGLLTNSSMFKKHKAEFVDTVGYLHREKYAPMFKELAKIFEL